MMRSTLSAWTRQLLAFGAIGGFLALCMWFVGAVALALVGLVLAFVNFLFGSVGVIALIALVALLFWRLW